MVLATVARCMLQGLGPLASPPGILVALVALAVILIVGRVVLAIAWRIVVLAALAVAVLWVLGILGFKFGILQSLGV